MPYQKGPYQKVLLRKDSSSRPQIGMWHYLDVLRFTRQNNRHVPTNLAGTNNKAHTAMPE